MIAALLRVKTPSKIKIFSSCTVIRGAFKNKWLDKWQDNGWKTNKGGQVAHAGLWKYIDQISKDHDLIAAADDDINTYKSWMLNQLNKKEE
jgi:ribonuclease HI